MRLKSKFTLLIFLVLTSFLISDCSHYDMEKRISMTSTNGEDESHNNGQNCMNCHSQGKKGEGWFNMAGSVYKIDKVTHNANGKIHLFTEPNGQGVLKYTLEVDGKGNFYTTKEINFEGGLYPAHESSQGVFAFMQSPTISGQCQSCHNISTDKIFNQ